MTRMFGNYHSVSLFILLQVSMSMTARAEYNQVRLGEAIGAYLISVDVLNSFNESECEYIHITSPTMEEVVQDAIKYLRPSDASSLLEYINSSSYMKELKENDEFVNGYLSAGINDGLDIKTLCGSLASIVALQYQTAYRNWEYSKEFYARELFNLTQ